MIIVCTSCQARYKFDESRLGERPKVKTRCTKCGGTIEIENPLMGAMTLPPEPEPEPELEPEPPTAPSHAGDSLSTHRSLNVESVPRGREIGGETMSGRDLHDRGMIELPKDRRLSLAVIQGAATGQIFQITKTRTVIGRSGSDIVLDDPEASRQHAAIEIVGDTAILRDLGSTNGTFIELERIEQQLLNNHMEFRIGTHVLMFIVTAVE